jgi:hypothetical protein
MKKIIYFIVAAALVCGCAEDEGAKGTEGTGSIYGVVTDKTTIEPMRGTGVELYAQDEGYFSYSLLTRTVTYDDGHYEFNDLKAGNYELVVEAEGYERTKYDVIVESGRTAKGDMQLEKVNTHMTVRTLDITDIGGNSATLKGSCSWIDNSDYAPNEVGFVYATHSNPANGGTKISASKDKLNNTSADFSVTITNLSKATYYVQAYAKNSIGTEYGEERSFQITGEPSVSTLPATNVTANAATLNGKIEYQGDPAYTEKGFVYSSTFANPGVDDDAAATQKRVVSGTSAEFSANVSGLTKNTTYYVRAYATNSNGTSYGQSISFAPIDINDVVVILQSEGIMVQKNDISSGANWTSASNLCKGSGVGGYSDWRLPTQGELQALYSNRTAIGGFSSTQTGSIYWSSTYSEYYRELYAIDFYDGDILSYSSSSNTYRVRCVRTLP